ncbi:MAG: GntR family transcriptional regulator [Atopobiaceae bacterium]|jgi:GntR family transcriptional regulator|nr:GntR family transcriptional regulator [Atopobiaceae bacterium]MCI2172662.1 GntR family transcriptional regulator [Atopobiaceae bacterium]MCI2206969.1 GntR family transcriptional regulator [Atopobiaceae bacterium]
MRSEGGLDGASPLYLQLREVIRSKIEDGVYAPGHAIPSENELAETYGINRLTVRNGIDALVSEGLLKRVQGRGVFVMGGKLDIDLDTFGGFRGRAQEINAGASVRILARARRSAGSSIARRLGIDAGDELFQIKRLNLIDDVPYELERVMIPVARVPHLDDTDLSVFSLYDVYGFSGITLARDSETLDIVTLEAKDARYLGVEPGSPAMLFSCEVYDDSDRVVECSDTLIREDKSRFTVHF